MTFNDMRENPFYNFWIDKGWTEIYIQHIGFPKRGNLNDKVRTDRQHLERGTSFKGISRKGFECIYKLRNEGIKKRQQIDLTRIWDLLRQKEKGQDGEKSSDREGD